MTTPRYPTYIITQEPGQVPRRKGPFFGNKMIEGFLRDAYGYNPDIICIVIDMETEDNTWYPEHGYEWLDMNGDGRKRHPRKDRPKQTPQPNEAPSRASPTGYLLGDERDLNRNDNPHVSGSYKKINRSVFGHGMDTDLDILIDRLRVKVPAAAQFQPLMDEAADAIEALRGNQPPQEHMTGPKLDERMKAAGMFTIEEMMGVTPLTKWKVQAGMTDLDAFSEWLDRKVIEYFRMKAAYDLGEKDEKDELYEWVLAHAGAYSSIRENFRAARAALTTEGQPDAST